MREIAPLGQRVQNVTYFEVEIEVTDPDAQLLRPRMSGDADIVIEVVEDALFVPETALRYRGERDLRRDGAWRRARRPRERDVADRHRRRRRACRCCAGLAEGDEVRCNERRRASAGSA